MERSVPDSVIVKLNLVLNFYTLQLYSLFKLDFETSECAYFFFKVIVFT